MAARAAAVAGKAALAHPAPLSPGLCRSCSPGAAEAETQSKHLEQGHPSSAALLTPPDSAKVADNANSSSGTDHLGRINTLRCIIL